MQKINDIYRDISFVIHSQRETLDIIEDNIDISDKNVNKGTKELLKAESYQKSSKNYEYKLFRVVFTIAAGLGLGLGLK